MFFSSAIICPEMLLSCMFTLTEKLILSFVGFGETVMIAWLLRFSILVVLNKSNEGQLLIEGNTFHTRLSTAELILPAASLVLRMIAQLICALPFLTYSEVVPGNEPLCHQLL